MHGNGLSTKFLHGNGLSTKYCLVTGLQQNVAWKRAFNKMLPGNEPSTKCCLVMGLQRLHQNKRMLTRDSCKLILTCKESCILHSRGTSFRPILWFSSMFDSSYTTNGYTFLTSQRNIMSCFFFILRFPHGQDGGTTGQTLIYINIPFFGRVVY